LHPAPDTGEIRPTLSVNNPTGQSQRQNQRRRSTTIINTGKPISVTSPRFRAPIPAAIKTNGLNAGTTTAAEGHGASDANSSAAVRKAAHLTIVRRRRCRVASLWLILINGNEYWNLRRVAKQVVKPREDGAEAEG
jgi:hypothetical protein